MLNKKLFFKKTNEENPYIKFKMYPSILYVEISYQSHIGYFDKTGTADENDFSWSSQFYGSSGQLIDYESNISNKLTAVVFEISTVSYEEYGMNPYMVMGFWIEDINDTLLDCTVGVKFGEYDEYITTYRNIQELYITSFENSTLYNLKHYFALENKNANYVNDGVSYGGTWYEPSPEILLTFYP